MKRKWTHLKPHPGLVDVLQSVSDPFLFVFRVYQLPEGRLVPESGELLQFLPQDPEMSSVYSRYILQTYIVNRSVQCGFSATQFATVSN